MARRTPQQPEMLPAVPVDPAADDSTLPDEYYPPEHDEEPAPTPRGRRRAAQPAQDQDDQATPPYLRQLLSLPGVDPATLDGVPVGTAWLRIEAEDGTTRAAPLAFLAPEALDTLARWGFQGHTTFEVRTSQNGPVVRYFACELEPLDEDEAAPMAPGIDGAMVPAGAGDSRLLELLARQQQQMQHLAAQLAAMQQQQHADPLAGLERAFEVLGKAAKVLGFAHQAPAPAADDTLGRILDVAGKVAPLLGRGTQQAAPEESAPEESAQ